MTSIVEVTTHQWMWNAPQILEEEEHWGIIVGGNTLEVGGLREISGEGGSPSGSRWAAPSQALHSPDQGRPFLTSRPFYLLSITKFIWRLLRAATKFMRGTGARSMDWPSFASYSDNPSRLCSRFKSPRHKKKLKHERSTNKFYPIGSFVNMI